MRLSSPVFKHNQFIPRDYTCDGSNANPELEISEVPEHAKSLVLIMDDPDAPMGTWVHWTIWNINPTIQKIAKNSVPKNSVEGITTYGSKPGYGGPCPPSGTHRYFFKLYALDKLLRLNFSAKKSDLEKAMSGHIIAEAVLIGLYNRG